MVTAELAYRLDGRLKQKCYGNNTAKNAQFVLFHFLGFNIYLKMKYQLYLF